MQATLIGQVLFSYLDILILMFNNHKGYIRVNRKVNETYILNITAL